MIYATTASPDKIRFKDRKIEFDNADIVFQRTRPVEVTVKYGDTGRPAKNVFVELNNRSAGQWEVTGDDGRVELTVPAGEYRAMYLVEFGTPYISRYSVEAILQHKVEPPDMEQPKLEITLEPAATIDIEIVDAESGKPLPEVDVWIGDGEEKDSYQWRSWKPPRTSMVDRPRSDKDGKLRLFARPGLIVVGPGDEYPPKGYPSRKGGVELAVKGGDRRSVRLEMSR